jgi:hypothetical protein
MLVDPEFQKRRLKSHSISAESILSLTGCLELGHMVKFIWRLSSLIEDSLLAKLLTYGSYEPQIE